MPVQAEPVGPTALLDAGVTERMRPCTPAIDQPDDHKWRFFISAIVILLLSVVPTVLWPGAISWHWDEPMLIGQAYFYNQAHYPATRGLGGSFGVPYGPLPTQFYQLMLLFTHDTRVIVFVRALLFSIVLAGSFLWLARTLRLTPWFIPAILLAPFLNWSERSLWDATFALPIGALALASYAAFLRSRSRATFVTAIVTACIGPLIHMQGLPFFAAIVGHALWKHRPSIKEHWRAIALALTPIALLNVCYTGYFIRFLVPKMFGMVHNGYGGRSSRADILNSMSGAFRGGEIFNGDNLAIAHTRLPGPEFLTPLSVNLASMILYLIWLGILVAAIRMAWVIAVHRPAPRPPSVGHDAVRARDQIIIICIAALLMQMGLCTVLRVPAEPQYSFGTFAIHVMFAWLAVEFLRKLWLGYAVTLVYGLAVAYLTIGGNWTVHEYGWPRGLMSPSMNEQIDVARQLDQYSDPIVYTNVGIFQRFPRAIAVQRLLNPGPTPPPTGAGHRLYIRYKLNGDPTTQRVELIDLGSDPAPPEATLLDTTPAGRLY